VLLDEEPGQAKIADPGGERQIHQGHEGTRRIGGPGAVFFLYLMFLGPVCGSRVLKEDVRRLKVAVQDAMVVRVMHPPGNRIDRRGGLIARNFMPGCSAPRK
jgi:hypothetical protein